VPAKATQPEPIFPACVMGYYDAADVPVYDHLAEEFAVCDRWFSSVPRRYVAQPPVWPVRCGRWQQG
jgi:phospholipase C